jgi:leishmanolysin/Big-like domain-containing protein
MARRPLRFSLPVALGLLAACGGSSTEPAVPGGIVLNTASLTFSTVGVTQQLSATVTDQAGTTISSPKVAWSTSNGAVATVSGTGLVTSKGSGSAVITATAGAVSATAQVSVTQAPASIQPVAGNQQSANIGQAVATPLTVEVEDASGQPVNGVTVDFTVAADQGTLAAASAVSGADGRAASGFTPLGSGDITVTATVDGTSISTSFTETGVSPFTIELMFLTAPTAAQRLAFVAAQQRWQGLIVGDLPSVQLSAAAGQCGTGSPAITRTVDDLLILVTLEAIDGAGGVLGSAGPCFIRNGSRLPVLGIMKFDVADLDVLENQNLLKTVILHEMGHVLGYGTIWTDFSLLADPSQQNGTDPHFTGTQALAAFNQVGGSSYSGAKVPVEDTGGEGTADAHWRESVFGDELMTGFVDPGVDPLSRVSVASMADLGYTVNLQGADDYTLSPLLRATARGPRIHLEKDRLSLPLHVVDETGHVVRVVAP